MLHANFIKELGSLLNSDIEKVSSVNGGCINEAYKIEAKNQSCFIKINDAKSFPKMFAKESKDLDLLRTNSSFVVPKVIMETELDNKAILVLEYIEKGRKDSSFNTFFASSLAEMHKKSNSSFGLDHDNYIGSIKQHNTQHENWVDFFVLERLEKQIKLAIENYRLDNELSRKFERLYSSLKSIFPKEKPALLHGDLWSGNYMCTSAGKPCVFDPAIYYGHREMDIAMTTLFGGFDHEFYQKYNEYYPLTEDWERRVDICNLYPLLVHVNLFGGGYLQQVKSIFNRWV